MAMQRIHREILDAIDTIRAEHDACTAGEIARVLRKHKSYITRQLRPMKVGGLVTFTRVAGSIKTTAGHAPLDDLVTADLDPDAMSKALSTVVVEEQQAVMVETGEKVKRPMSDKQRAHIEALNVRRAAERAAKNAAASA